MFVLVALGFLLYGRYLKNFSHFFVVGFAGFFVVIDLDSVTKLRPIPEPNHYGLGAHDNNGQAVHEWSFGLGLNRFNIRLLQVQNRFLILLIRL